MNDSFSTEEEILLHFFNTDAGDDEPFLKNVQNGKFLVVLNSSFCEETFQEACQGSSSDELLETVLSHCVKSFLDQYAADSHRQQQMLCVGIASLSSFMQVNWTGPSLSTDEMVLGWLPEARHFEAVSCLEMDGEGCYTTVRHAVLLILARAVLRTCCDWLSQWPTCQWWWARALFVHQQVLDEYSPTLHAALMNLLSSESLASLCTNLSSQTRTIIHLEAARIHLYYGQVLNSKEQFAAALESAGMKMELVGALGRRTRFQQQDLAQLTLKVDVDETVEQINWHQTCNLPRDLRLNDEVRLDHIKFVSEEDGTVPAMTPVQQAVVLGMFVQTQKSQPVDELADEELLPYLQCVLIRPQWWSLQMAALLFRSRLESKHSRTVERALTQMQDLVDNISYEEPEVRERLWGLFSSHLPPYWQLEADLARLLVSLGSVNSALDVFLRLHMWDEVISCYTLLQLRHKAAEVIRQELAKKETVKLWCLLGDATDDPAHYKTAWELSGQRSGRAQRHWGLFYFRRKQNFEAWNNLAKAYVKTGHKARAWKALQEALKCNYENWRVWDNLLVVSTDCGEFEEVIRAYHRILDLKGKHVDTEVLSILAKAVGNNLADNQGVPAGRLLSKALGLFGRLTGQVTDNATLWRLYAELTASNPVQTTETLQKTAQYLQRAHRAAVQSLHWEKQVDSCRDVMRLCSSLADAYLQCCRNCPDKEQAVRMLNSARLSLKGVTSKVTQTHTDLATGEVIPALKDLLVDLLRKLEDIISEIQRLQETS
ncbi:tetratricopeptide repeat protein 27 isoform X2 [Anabrus simplex]|uniref:tetratricopeptide repeat protein 27 isoform X2 n=1 Tax=Anabrus simplex TaxID=316456 RepID=UPI0035A30D23